MVGGSGLGAVRFVMLAAAAGFAGASLVHAEVILPGNPDPTASLAERLIAAVLVVGLGIGWLRPAWARRAAVLALGFALVGDLLGLTIFVLADPEKVLDIAFHVAMAVLVAVGLVGGSRAIPAT
jgi:hypothetical protein